MENIEILDNKIQEKFGASLLTVGQDFDFPVYEFTKPEIKNAIAWMKQEQGFIYLTTLCGLHFPDNEKSREFAMMYQLHNLVANQRVRFKTFMSREDMQLPTIIDIYDAANWMEREAFDFFGFTFEGHPKMVRILNMEEMNYHPMRKEYPLEDLQREDKDDKFFGR